MVRIHLVVPVLLVLLACEPAPPPAPVAPDNAAPEPAAPQAGAGPASVTDAAALDAMARRLAGLAGSEDHAAAMNAIWDELDAKHLVPMRAWRDATLAPLAGASSPLAGTPVFYPFGGPNFLNAHTFFPDAPAVVLVGLEPPGPIPSLEGLDEAELTADLERLAGAFGNLVRAGYFVRTQMDRQLVQAESLEGLLPMMAIFLARTGHHLEAVTFIDLADDGKEQPAPAARSGEGGSVRLDFRTADGEARRLYYFSQDLADEGLLARPGFLAFVHRLGPFRTTMKSAEYLLHMDGFGVLSDFLVAESLCVLQDDSGLPLSALASGPFELRFFGTYTEVLPSYGEWFQPDLVGAFQEAEPLPFSVGYHVELGGSALILGLRR